MADDPEQRDDDTGGDGDADLLDAARAGARRLVGDLESQRAGVSTSALDDAIDAARRVLEHLGDAGQRGEQ